MVVTSDMMMTTQLTREEVIQQQYQSYLQKRTQRQTEEAEAKRLQEERKAQVQAAINKNVKVVTVRKPHRCNHCNSVIARGEKATVSNGIAMVEWKNGFYGDVLGYYSVYICQRCRPSK